MTVSHWFHINTYIALGVILVILTLAVVLSIRRMPATSGRLDTR
jgi:hypothetical protein